MEKVFIGLLIVVLGIACGVGLLLLSSLILMLVWNTLAYFFGFHTISYLIAICINIALGLVAGIFKST